VWTEILAGAAGGRTSLWGVRTGLSWVVVAACAALVGLLAYGLAARGADTSIDEALLRGERPAAPAKELPVLGGDGRSASLADYRGKVVVLNVWASWCDPCVDELPLLQETQERIQGRGATLLGVNAKDFTDEALAMERRFGLTFPSLRDRDGTFVREFGTVAYPETFVIDRQGRVAAKRRGPVDAAWLDETLPAIIRETA
jgi:cytochrome c biogenesis protein CcmG/thiol:disulfide interchange protein DsbE